jgi:hypothetical protein
MVVVTGALKAGVGEMFEVYPTNVVALDTAR